jgi:hypothetical protein
VVHLDSRISPRIFEKIRNGLNGILWSLGETDSWKKPEAKNLCPFKLHALAVSLVQIACTGGQPGSNCMHWRPNGTEKVYTVDSKSHSIFACD